VLRENALLRAPWCRSHLDRRVDDIAKSDTCNSSGDSGGPLFTWDGYAVAIVSGKDDLGCGASTTTGYYYPVENVLWEQSGNGIGLLTP
jgi:hypothetical protein